MLTVSLVHVPLSVLRRHFYNSYFIQLNEELQVDMCGIAEAGSRGELNRSECSNDCHTDIVKESVHNIYGHHLIVIQLDGY